MRRRRTTNAVHADRRIPKLLKNIPGIKAVFFIPAIFAVFTIFAALTIYVSHDVYAETHTGVIPAAKEKIGTESETAVPAEEISETGSMSESGSQEESVPVQEAEETDGTESGSDSSDSSDLWGEDRVSITFQMESNGIYAIVYTIRQEADGEKDPDADGGAESEAGSGLNSDADATAAPAGEAGKNEDPALDGTAEQAALVRALPAGRAFEGEDEAYILVKKIFSGITEEEIPDDFSVAISDGTTAYILTRDPQEENITYSASEDGLTRTWRVDHVITGAAYMISEFGEEIEGYTVTSSGLGDTQTVTAADITYTIGKHETTCSQQDWPVDDNTLFAASMTNKTGGKGSLIISKYRLSESERRAVEEILLPRLRAVDSNVWKMPVHYYSVEEHPDGFQINAGIVTYDPDAQQVTLSDTDIWQHVASVSFTKNEPGNGDFTILNDYERIPGVELPSSGGPGTRTLYMLGLAIIVLAGAGLVLRKWGP